MVRTQGVFRGLFSYAAPVAAVFLLAACAAPKQPNGEAANPVLAAETAPSAQRFPTSPPPAPVVELSPSKAEPTRALRIGLALGGGAARGFSHVGVIKVLEANGIHIDVVTGTSAGSMVAVMHASGMTGTQLQQAAHTMDEATLADWTLSTRGMIKGEALQSYINAQVKNRTLERMVKPVGVIATDFESGAPVVFTRGNAGMAVRASASIPGVFSPSKIDGKTYVDGGLSSPVPAKAAKGLGADFVIAVDISARPGRPPEGLAATLNQTVAIMGQNLRIEELKHFADVVIHPSIDHISGTDFTVRSTLITEGEKAARTHLDELRSKITAAKLRLNLR